MNMSGSVSESLSIRRYQRVEKRAVNLAKASLAVGGFILLLSCWHRGAQLPFQRPRDGRRKQPEAGNEMQALESRALPIELERSEHFRRAVALESRAPTMELERSEQFGRAVALKSEKIVYCPIAKVACAEWLNAFRWVDGQEDWQEPRHVKHGLNELSRMELKSANQILNSPEWLKVAIVRKPTERLLSCFLQKCKKWNFKTEYINCPYLELWPDLFTSKYPSGETFSVIVDAFEERGWKRMFADYVNSIARQVEANPCDQNPHWSPQYCHCSLDRTSSVYHIAGWANMTEVVSSAIVPVASTVERGQEIAEFLQSRMKYNHESPDKKTGAGHYIEEAYSESMLETVRVTYAKDYELFSKYW